MRLAPVIVGGRMLLAGSKDFVGSGEQSSLDVTIFLFRSGAMPWSLPLEAEDDAGLDRPVREASHNLHQLYAYAE